MSVSKDNKKEWFKLGLTLLSAVGSIAQLIIDEFNDIDKETSKESNNKN